MTQHLIEIVAQGIEAFAVIVIVIGISNGIIRYFLNQWKQIADSYKRFKDSLGKTLLLGLELLVAADIIRTVALSSTMLNVVMLAILVIIRTFLSWSLVVEMEGSWPWQARKE
jgi:uncharacterized membrane protein